MYYVLLTLLSERCGADIMNEVGRISAGRVKVGPGTVYMMLDKFLQNEIILQTSCHGRTRSYIITPRGRQLLDEEFRRLQTMYSDGRKVMEKE